MLYIASRKQIEEYRQSDALGQSQLKKLLVSMDEFLKEDVDKQSPAMIIGSAVDTILTGNEEDFDNLFHVTSFSKPSDVVSSICALMDAILAFISLGSPAPSTIIVFSF